MGVDTLTTPAETAEAPHRVVTIMSPKGGAGKTTVATNLAVGLARHYPRQVVIIDLDLQFGDVANVLQLQPIATIGDIARQWPVDTANLKLALTSHRSGMYSLCAPLDPAEADDVTADHVVAVIAALQRSFRYVIVDTDPGLSERVLSALDASTDIVMICSTEVPSIRGLQKAIQALNIVGLTHAERHFLLNRSNAKVGIELADIERTIGQEVDIELPSSIDMVRATNEGVPVMESQSNAELVAAFQKLVDTIDPQASPSSSGHGRRLFKRKA
jgi:pilus assembly protein CpaE